MMSDKFQFLARRRDVENSHSSAGIGNAQIQLLCGGEEDGKTEKKAV